MTEQTKFTLGEEGIPTHWVNLMPDLPGEPLPPLSPATMEPAGPEDLTIFPMELIGQEVSAEPEVEIPEPVRDAYRLWRPTPLYRAHRLERELDTPARIYYKYEGVSPAGSPSRTARSPRHTRTSRPASSASRPRPVPGSGALLASPARCSGSSAPSTWSAQATTRSLPARDDGGVGAKVIRSPSDSTEAGRSQASHPTGSLGIAISEAVEVAAGDAGTNYALGSVLNHVCLHQTVIGQEAIAQMEMAGDEPDVVVGCMGGGSNFAGMCFPFLRRVLRGRRRRASWLPSPPHARRSRAACTATTSATPWG